MVIVFDQWFEQKREKKIITALTKKFIHLVHIKQPAYLFILDQKRYYRESLMTVNTLSNEQRVENLLQWLLNEHTKSVISDKINVQESKESGRGLYAKEDINAHTPIIKIDHSYLLNFTTIVAHISSWNPSSSLPDTYKHIKLPPKGKEDEVTDLYKKLTLNDLTRLSSFQIMAMFLVLEKSRGSDSWWEPFINMLPLMDDFLRSPFIWKVQGKDDLFKQLPRSTRNHATRMATKFSNDYETVLKLLKDQNAPESMLPYDDFLLYWMCINSRCLYMEMPQKKTTDDNFTMAPYVDFINHSSTDQCVLKIDRSGFNVITSNLYKQGEELFLSYGPHSNEFLLCEYGFYLPRNEWNDLDISDEIIDTLNPDQIDYLKEHHYFGDYTLNHENVSFRTDVALAVYQEKQNLHSNKRLNALLNGVSDGSYYKRRSNQLLIRILQKLKSKYENFLPLEFNDDDDMKVVGVLHRERVDLIDLYLEKLTQ